MGEAALTDTVAEAAKGKMTGYRWIVLSLLFIVYTVAFADRANIGIALPSIRKDFGLTNTQAGMLVSAFTLVYGFAQMPAAFLVRRIGVRAAFTVCLILISIATVWIGAAAGLMMLVAARVFLGLAEAPLAIGALTTINNWYSNREKGTAQGIFLASSKLGPLLVPPLGAMIILAFDWRHIFYFCAIPGLILAPLWFLLVADDPRKSRYTSAKEADHVSEKVNNAPSVASSSPPRVRSQFVMFIDRMVRSTIVERISSTTGVLRSWNVWGVAVGYFFINGVVGVLLAWLPTYLTDVKHFKIMNVGIVSAAPFAGAVVGNFIGGAISDWFLAARRKPTMMLTSAATIVMMYTLTGAPDDIPALTLLLFVTGVLFSVGYSGFTIYASRLTTREAFPIAASITNMMGQMGAAFAPLVTGMILDRYSWDPVFIFLSICSAGAFLILCTVVEPLSEREYHLNQ